MRRQCGGTGPVHRTFNFGLGRPQSSSHCSGFSFRKRAARSCYARADSLAFGSRTITSIPRARMKRMVSSLEELVASPTTTRGMPNWMMAPVHMKQGWSVVYIVCCGGCACVRRRGGLPFRRAGSGFVLDEGIVAGRLVFRRFGYRLRRLYGTAAFGIAFECEFEGARQVILMRFHGLLQRQAGGLRYGFHSTH